MNTAVGGGEGRVIMTITFRDCLCFILLSRRSYSPLVALAVSFDAAIQKRKGHFSWRRTKSQQLSRPYLLILVSSFRLCPDPSSLTPVTGLFFRNSFQPLMDIPSTDGFWFRLLMLSASPNIHFGCSAPSHWFLWRWNSDWTDLSWRPRGPHACLAPLQHMKEDAPCPTDWQTMRDKRTGTPYTARPIFEYDSFM